MGPSSQRSVLLYSDQDHSVAIYGRTVLSFSLQPPNPGFLAAWAAAMDRLAGAAPAAISAMTVIDAGARIPDDASKAAIQATVLRHRQQICAFAYVIEGQGFSAAAMRSCLSIISLAARYPFPQRVFANVPDAAAWTLAKMPVGSAGSNAAGIASTFDGMRAQVTRVIAATG